MSHSSYYNAEQPAENAFTKQAPLFDELYNSDAIIQYKRKRVRAQVEQYLHTSSSILELNAGTGEDAIYFAGKGHRVHATDISGGMQEVLKQKVAATTFSKNISTELCSFTELTQLQNKGPYDYIFSNFAGLNCTNELGKVLDELPGLLKPGGHITLVILPLFCTWELLLALRGKFRTAFRRFVGKKGAQAHIEGVYFRCWYYNPSYVRKRLKNVCTVKSLEGLCTIVPPSYMENFAVKHPRLFGWLVKKENKYKSHWPWRVTGDYYIMTLQKKQD